LSRAARQRAQANPAAQRPDGALDTDIGLTAFATRCFACESLRTQEQRVDDNAARARGAYDIR